MPGMPITIVGMAIIPSKRQNHANSPTRLQRAAAVCSATTLAALSTATAGSALAATSNYARWDQSGNLAVAAVGFPSAQWTTTAANPRVPNGSSTFLNAATPMGQAFGSSQ